MLYESPPKSSNGAQPKFVNFIQALMAFKRLARTMKRWYTFEERQSMRLLRSHSSLFTEVQKTDKIVLEASSGKQIITVQPHDIHAARLAMKQNKVLLVRERQRGIDEKILLQQDNENPNNLYKVRTDHLHFAENLQALQANFDKQLFQRLDALRESTDADGQITSEVVNMYNRNSNNRDTLNAKKKRGDKTDYLPGTSIYFGSTVAIQARHGGYMSYANSEHVKASAHKILPYARYVVVNCDDPIDNGLLRYGDAIWLQAGVHEVLGAIYVSEEEKAKRNISKSKMGNKYESDGRMIVPAMINSRKANAFKAHQYGRWIVLHKDKPLETLGEYVTHLDTVMFEQGWFFMSSATPYDSYMTRQGSFEQVTTHDLDAFNPGQDSHWKIHLVALPKDTAGSSNRNSNGPEMEAFEQLETSKEFRYSIQNQLMGTLEESLPKKLHLDSVMVHQLGHKMDPDNAQKALLKKYLVQSLNRFSTEKRSIAFLEKIYGEDSLVVYIARERQILHEKELGNAQFMQEMGNKLQERQLTRKPKLELMSDQYWDNAAAVMLNTKVWSHLPSAMNHYYITNFEKKHKAAKKITKFFRFCRKKNYTFDASLRNIENDIQKELHVKMITMKRDLFRKGAERNISDHEVQKQWEEMILSDADMDPKVAARLRKINDELAAKSAETERLRKLAKDKAAKMRAESERNKAELERKRIESEALKAGGVNKRRPQSQQKPKILRYRNEFGFRGYEPPEAREKSIKDTVTMSRSAAAPLPPHHHIYSIYDAAITEDTIQVNTNDAGSKAMDTSKLPELFITRGAEIPTRNMQSRPQTAPNIIRDSRNLNSTSNSNSNNDIDNILKNTQRTRDPRLAESDGFLVAKRNGTPSNDKRIRTYNLENIVKSPEKVHGLSKEVVKEKNFHTSLKTGLAFLRATSKNSKMYEDIKVVRKKRKSKSSKK